MKAPPLSHRVRGWILFISYAGLLTVALWRAGDGPGRSAEPPPTAKTPAPAGDKAIAVVAINGVIGQGGGFGQDDSDGISRRLRRLRDDEDVGAVVLRINSPGGSVGAVQEIHAGVLALRRAGKKVVASFGDVAASGGYYVAAPADRIVALPGSIVGSIGVIFSRYNVEELTRKVGVRFETIKSGALKDMGSSTRPLSPEERRIFEGLVRSAYGQFFRAVADGRRMEPRRLEPLADGRVFTGEQALANGLVDSLGGFDEALDEARRLAGIRSPRPRVIDPEKSWRRLVHLLGESWRAPWDALTRFPRARLEYVWE